MMVMVLVFDRMLMFALTTVYAVVAVYVFDAFRPRVQCNPASLSHKPSPA